MPTPKKLAAIVERIIQHNDTVKTIIIEPLKPCPNFRPGQFLHFAIDEYDPSTNWPESRVFSIANSPTRRENLKITFSIKGFFTNRMFTEVCEGSKVWLKLPYGDFLFPENKTEVVLIAGGTGITPFISYLEYAIDKTFTNKITLYYGMRNSDNLLYESLLSDAENMLQNFQCHLFIEEGKCTEKMYSINKGILPIEDIIKQTYSNYQRSRSPIFLYYLSGPPKMIQNFTYQLLFYGVRREHILVDKWE